MTDTELEQLNHAVAAIAGYTDIKQLDTSRNQETQPKKKIFVGKMHLDRVRFIPDYVTDLNATTKVFDYLRLGWTLSSLGYASHKTLGSYAETPAIALCKLLVAIAAAKTPLSDTSLPQIQ